MTRRARVDFPGAIHHVYARGIEKRAIYLDDSDRCDFLGRVGSNLAKWHIACCAWALMPNHFHLLVRSDGGCLPSFMQCLLTGYSMYFNDRHKRVGHLFQNRYKSPLIDSIKHCRDVARYIHLNPLRSGIVPSLDALEEYPWTGHRRIVRGGAPGWQDVGLLREAFHGSPAGAEWVPAYLDYLESAVRAPIDLSDFEGIGGQAESDDGPVQLSSGPHEIFTDLLQRISASHGVPIERVLSRDRDYIVIDIRRAILKKCTCSMKIPIAQIARWMGMSAGAARYLLNSCR
ncbi:MAG: transposase [Thermodesulfobacteriota bacterium]